ncbi:MAG: type II CAAX endopeptidase family protein [Chloroflexota bacterium]
MLPLPSISPRPILARIFISSDEPRLRAGWRLLFQTIIMLFLLGCLGLPIGFLIYIPDSSISDQQLMLFSEGISFFAILSSVFLSRRFLDKRSFSSLGLENSSKMTRDLIAGFLIAFLSMSFLYIVEILLGWAKFKSFAWDTQSPVSVLSGSFLAIIIFILVGWNEELLSRGYHLQTLAAGTNFPIGLILSSIIFGILHVTNPNASWISTLGIILAGLFLGFGYMRTRQLWLPIGLHIGWNFSEGVVFGFPVSGWNGFQITNSNFAGPQLWTGGAFGPEAGLIVLPTLMIGTLLIHLYTLPKYRL